MDGYLDEKELVTLLIVLTKLFMYRIVLSFPPGVFGLGFERMKDCVNALDSLFLCY